MLDDNPCLLFRNLIYLPKDFAKKIFYLLLRPMKFVPKTVLTITFVAAFTVAAALVAGISLAASNEPPPPPSPGPGPVPPGLPIDGGVIVLMLFGLATAFYKIHQLQHKKTQA